MAMQSSGRRTLTRTGRVQLNGLVTEKISFDITGGVKTGSNRVWGSVYGRQNAPSHSASTRANSERIIRPQSGGEVIWVSTSPNVSFRPQALARCWLSCASHSRRETRKMGPLGAASPHESRCHRTADANGGGLQLLVVCARAELYTRGSCHVSCVGAHRSMLRVGFTA